MIQTTFGDVRVVDAHAHFFSHRFFATLAKQLPEPPGDNVLFDVLGEKLPFEFPGPEPTALAERWIKEMDRHGVDRMVIIASVPGDEESVAEAAGTSPKRFIPYFMLDPFVGDAAERTRRAFEELGMKGLCLFPAMHHFHVWEAELNPIFERVAEAGGVVFVHCGVLKVGVRDKLGLPSPFDLRYANPVDLSGLARRYPGVPFIVPHFGGGFLRELLLVAHECSNIYTDTSSTNRWMSLLPENLGLEEVFRRALDVLGPERILYGSDSSFFPRGWQKPHFDLQVETVRRLSIDPGDAAGIFGGNLERLLDVDRTK